MSAPASARSAGDPRDRLVDDVEVGAAVERDPGEIRALVAIMVAERGLDAPPAQTHGFEERPVDIE